MKKEEEYVFLKRTPKIFLVGDPEKLGYKKVDERTSKDSAGIDWFSATNTVASMIFDCEEIAYGLSVEWFNVDVIYYYETPKLGVRYDDHGYLEFETLMRDAHNFDDCNHLNVALLKLFEYSKPIEDYAIPEEGTKEREWFNRAVKMWKADVAERTERTWKVERAIRDIMEAHVLWKVERQ